MSICNSAQFFIIMPSATSNAKPARIPAWKRLGLKLKSASDTTNVEVEEVDTVKRRREEGSQHILSNKKAKKANLPASPANPITPTLVRKKSVAFTPETKVDDGDSIKQLFNSWVTAQKSQDPSFELRKSNSAFNISEAPQIEEEFDTTLPEKERRVKRVKVSKEDKANSTQDSTPKKQKSLKSLKTVKPMKPSTRPFLSYLRQYHEDRANWKFNKNHQNYIIKHIFDLDIIPSDHIHYTYYYVRSLQGGVRARLRDTAIKVKVEDQEAAAGGFPDSMDQREKKQQEYDLACKEYVAFMTELNASSHMGYEEGILAGLSDSAMKGRIAKRTRAEQILTELGQDGGGGNGLAEPEEVNADDESQKRLRMNNGYSQKVARKRKQRTMVEDADTSSSGESSDSDSSEDAPDPGPQKVHYNGDDTSSSSSSSSSSSDSEEEEEDDDSGEESEDDSDESGDE
jgi:hypothetical protein